jgi:hypothetical protein
MSWRMNHSQSGHFAGMAEVEMRDGNVARAMDLYRQAAVAELDAIDELDHTKIRTLSVSVVSAAALLFKANEFKHSQVLAHKWLGEDILLPFAIEQLQEILQKIWSEESLRQAKINFAPGEVLVSVSGGQVIYGGAPLELIQRKVDEVRNIFYRTIEFLMQVPFRRNGLPDILIQEQCQPWLFHAPAGSYQFAVRVQKPQQLMLPGFGDVAPQVAEVTHKFLEIVGAAATDPQDELTSIIPDEDYRKAFLRLTRNLAPAPDGHSFSQISIRPADNLTAKPITFVPNSRENINLALKPKKVQRTARENREDQLTGVLRALDLNKDWIEITIGGERENIKIYDAQEAIDDVIGPMVNHRVIVDVTINPSGKHFFQDIQRVE